MKRYSVCVLAASLLAGSAVSTASAAEFVALVGDRTLVRIDADTRQVLGRATVQGNGALIGFDVRPDNGRLYGLFENGTLATIAPKSGKLTVLPIARIDVPEAQASVDFNPVADRLRVIAITGENLRINVDDGATTVDAPINFGSSNPFGDGTPRVVGAAYTNSVAGTVATQLFDIDSQPEAVYEQLPPNAGTLVGVGRLGVDIGSKIGFDIQFAAGQNRAYMMSEDMLYRVNLETGAVNRGQKVFGLEPGERARDIAFLPN